MLIAHISDFHVFARQAETSLVRSDAADAARKVAADLAAFKPALDAIVFTGDLTDGGSKEDYALLKDILSPVRAPIFVIPGNHDKRPTLRAAFFDRLPFKDARFLHYEANIGGLRVLALDTLVEGRVEGRLCPERLEWVRRAIAQETARPMIIAMHHPPFPSGIPSLDAMTLVEGGEELGRLMAARRGQVRILCGHIHRPFHGIWNDAFVAVAGSPAFQVQLDLTPRVEEPRLVNEPYAYFIHRLDPAGGFSVHTRYVQT